MEEKREIKVRLSTVVYLFIILILVVALGVVYYLGFVKDDNANNMIANGEVAEINKNVEQNIITNTDVLGIYEYDVPQEVRDEYGNYYDGITIELLEDNKFEYYYGEGHTLEGVFQMENNNIVCNAKTIEGEYLDKQEINVKYTFKYLDNTLELTNKEGKVKFNTYGSTEIKEIEEICEEIGSKFIKNNIVVNEQVPEVNNKVEEKLEDNVSEEDLNKYKGKEAISLIAKEDIRFVINEIKNNGDTYIISASILEKEPRKILEYEYNNILDGQEVTFRDIKWKYDKSINDEYATYLKSTNNYDNMQATANLALRSGNTEGVRYFTNIAGVAGDLCDYSDIKVEFEVSKDIKVCSFWGEFEYVNGKLVCRNIDNEAIETTVQTIDTLIEFRNNNEPGTCGTYEECIAYVANGKVDAIKIFEK